VPCLYSIPSLIKSPDMKYPPFQKRKQDVSLGHNKRLLPCGNSLSLYSGFSLISAAGSTVYSKWDLLITSCRPYRRPA
ncbi:MAG TPA: hypothetical protein DCS74_04285, partial [Veillonellaceae bacterium]|nr:hypothetical protein [Veillonellaceae bacterium]